MSGLVIKLAPHERILINGAVVENGDKRSKLAIVTPDANILRLRDAIHPDTANTPVRRLCYVAQLLITGDADDPKTTCQQLLRRIEELSRILTDHDSRHILAVATETLLSGKYYQCLKSLRALLPREERLLASRPI